MEHEIRTWCNWLSLKWAVSTVDCYQWELKALAKHYPDKTTHTMFTLDDLTAYLSARRARGGRFGEPFSDAAIKRSVNAIKSFFKFHAKEASPAIELPRPREKKRIQRSLSLAQALDVLASCDTSTATGCRDVAMLALMMDSALRCAEVCRLKLDTIDWEMRVFPVIVKGGDEEYGGFSEETANLIKTWLLYREKIALPETRTLFCSVGGLDRGRCLTTSGMRVIFRKICKHSALNQRLSPHDLRRTFTMIALRFKAPTRVVQVAGRWHRIDMVERYSRALVLEDFKDYYPVKNILGGGS